MSSPSACAVPNRCALRTPPPVAKRRSRVYPRPEDTSLKPHIEHCEPSSRSQTRPQLPILPTLATPVTARDDEPSSSRGPSFSSALIAFSGAMCLAVGAAALALASSAPMSSALLTSTVCGAVGSLFTLAALVHNHGGECFVLLSLLCSVIGTVCVVAATQKNMATMFVFVGDETKL
ncbi:unnamed protein product [Peniophora sp. CBMAI 1063]|nr:unnamed protein product [Peniophora sp. CBMAI 1063]